MKTTHIRVGIVSACLLAGSGFAIARLLGQQAEIKSLRAQLMVQRAEIESLHMQLAARPANRANVRPPTPEVIPPANKANAFDAVTEGAIPGRYKWTQSDQEKGIITLFADHTFENHKGEKFSAYRWKLSSDRLVLEWNIGSIHFTAIESPGVYAGFRTDGQTERMEKIESR
jgi:hypothetical protein